jgi:serine/threonine-protein kinase
MELEQLGPYRIGRKLGKGGMGSVYEAVDENSGRRVAVKALTPQLAMAEGFRERFEAEIESLKKLEHEGIVRLYGYGEDDGVLFYSMELVEGPSLEQELNDGRRFDWRETLAIAIQVCRALKHAHDHGVVHRDIKPANLLLAPGDRVKIADFGIARLFGATQLTTAGGILGTADYMSPEQVDGRAVTDRCDQYALGCVMFALLSGRPPFRAKTMAEMLQMQRFAEPEPVRRFAPDVPVQLDGLIRQLLSKNPADRFPNVLVLARHMEAMQKALSRPEKSSERGEAPGAGAADKLDSTLVLGADKTILPSGEEPLGRLETTDSGVYDAPTLAEEGAPAAEPSAGPPPVEAGSPAGSSKGGTSVTAKERRFTTVDRDAERAREVASDRWMLGLQLVGLTAALVAMGFVGWRLTRPATADALYATIAEGVEANGGEDLSAIDDELTEFLARFPDDKRVVRVQAWADELELERLERKLRARARLSGDKTIHPAAHIYAEAIGLEDSNPARAVAMLESLLALYRPTGVTADAGEDVQPYMVLAERQVERLRGRLDQLAGEQLPALNERFAAARKLEESAPTTAAKMYRAIEDLYGDEPWAAGPVDEARARLKALGGN